jgi:hypothetical protein
MMPPCRVTLQGTRSSKKRKQAKLKRVMSTLKKAARREAAAGGEGFAALHLLHDPQVRRCTCMHAQRACTLLVLLPAHVVSSC